MSALRETVSVLREVVLSIQKVIVLEVVRVGEIGVVMETLACQRVVLPLQNLDSGHWLARLLALPWLIETKAPLPVWEVPKSVATDLVGDCPMSQWVFMGAGGSQCMLG